MSKQTTPKKIQLFLDELVRVSLRHGLKIRLSASGVSIDPLDYDGGSFRGYECWGDAWEFSERSSDPPSRDTVCSFDPTEISNHERMEILNGRSLLNILSEMEPLPTEDALPDVDEPLLPMTDIITTNPAIRGGRPVIRSMRISVSDILGWLASGMSDAEILKDFPELTEADIRAALSFADITVEAVSRRRCIL